MPSGVLQQNPARTQWDSRLAPGLYASITLDNAAPVCVVGSGVGSDPGVLRWTYNERVYGASGVRA